MRNVVMVVLVMLVGCMSEPASMPDAQVEQPPETCPAPADAHVDFLGEACTEAAFPAVTSCHGGAGWCVAGTCRPQCNTNSCRHCDDGQYLITDRGACYCSPD